MNLEELKIELQKLAVPPSAYSLFEGLKPDAIHLDHYHGIWKVFYFSERGDYAFERHFATKNEACAEILKRLQPPSGPA